MIVQSSVYTENRCKYLSHTVKLNSNWSIWCTNYSMNCLNSIIWLQHSAYFRVQAHHCWCSFLKILYKVWWHWWTTQSWHQQVYRCKIKSFTTSFSTSWNWEESLETRIFQRFSYYYSVSNHTTLFIWTVNQEIQFIQEQCIEVLD